MWWCARFSVCDLGNGTAVKPQKQKATAAGRFQGVLLEKRSWEISGEQQP